MVRHHVDDHLYAQGVGARDQLVVVGKGAVVRVDVEVVRNVVAGICLRRGVERRYPDRIYPQFGQVVELRNDARQIPQAVCSRVREGPRVDLVDYCAAPPLIHVWAHSGIGQDSPPRFLLLDAAGGEAGYDSALE